MQYTSDAMALWPSLEDFAADVGVPYTLLRIWRFRKSIPFQYWWAVEGAAKRRRIKGVTCSDMAFICRAAS